MEMEIVDTPVDIPEVFALKARIAVLEEDKMTGADPMNLIAALTERVTELEEKRRSSPGLFAGEGKLRKGFQGKSNITAIKVANKLEALSNRLRGIIVK